MTADRPPSKPSTVHQDSSAKHCYLVTGVAGFIASKVAELLLGEGLTASRSLAACTPRLA